MLGMSCVCHDFTRLFIAALWSPAEKGLTAWLSFLCLIVFLSYPGSGVGLDCTNS